MKIEIEASDIGFKYETKENLTAAELIDIAYRIMDRPTTQEDCKPKIVQMKPVAQPVHMERPAIRDRLPNSLVDINDLDIKKAVQTSSLVRCPHCGQSHALIVRDGAVMYMMQKRDKEFKIIIGPSQPQEMLNKYVMPDDANPLDYYNDLMELGIQEDKDFAVNNDTDIFCPVCHQSAAFIEWKKAYDEPLTYFEYENPCEVCGGETVVLKARDDGEVLYGCESCGHESV